MSITTDGQECQLPFHHGGREYNSCVMDEYRPWCVMGRRKVPLGNTPNEKGVAYGICLSNWGELNCLKLVARALQGCNLPHRGVTCLTEV